MMRLRSLTALPLLALALAGCDMAPKHVRPAGAVPTELPQGGAYPAAAAGTVDPTTLSWRDFFVDDKLRQVIALGLENNRDLRIAVGNVAQARAQYRVQRADLLPTLNGTGSATYTNNLASFGGTGTGSGGVGGGTAVTSSSTIKIYQANVGLSQFEIDLFGRVRNLTKAAFEQYMASEEGQRATRISLIGEIATAYVTLAADQDQMKIAQQTLQSFEESLKLTTAQFKIGTASELESRQAETNYEGAKNDLAALRAQIAQDQNALNLLAGTTVPAELLPQELGDHAFTISDLPAGLSSEILQRRPDVLQAEHQLKAQDANIGAARAAFFPKLSLTASLGTIAPALSNLFDSGTKAWTVAPSAVLPIFDFGRNAANLRYAKASQQMAVSTYEKTLQTAFREVADALAQRGTIDDQLGARTRRAEAATVAAKLADARYRAGVDSFLTSLDSQRTSYAANLDLTTTRLTRATNLVTLYRTLGGGLN
ncbi:efflux transporter outer membrane subunit [Sphingomonas sp. AP4-R1]|uniref:efflux transporter outer membrane subunit n=1 Tax=Sphingomonas sp. AP4-R1 TaxID=2735134 RepID=UPI001493405F|nr:efflux transporter outer membrane subunit [Sphingomonas sp. AP4-R1]QJU60349.1 efflux transporter outer membrane subunit [Sphingomonas sp. AP4-R1]